MALAALVALRPGPAGAAARPAVSALIAKGAAPYQRALAAFQRAYDGPVKIHNLEFDDDALSKMRAENPALILAVGVKAAKAVQVFGNVPVVYCMVIEPRANGIGGPLVVGVPLEVPAEVQLSELKRLLPAAQRVGLVYNPERSARELDEAQAAAQKLSLALVAEPARSAAEFPAALQRLLPKAQALWLLADSTVVTQDTFQLMLESALAQKLPLLAFSDDFVQQGALFALAPDFEGAGIEAARLAVELAHGKKPSELPAAPSRWNLVVNLSTARSLGVAIPPEVLKNAITVQ